MRLFLINKQLKKTLRLNFLNKYKLLRIKSEVKAMKTECDEQIMNRSS